MSAPPISPDDSKPARTTCDASGMAEIHRLFRVGFGEGRALVTGVADGNAAHAEVVADHLLTLSAALHTHHGFEDAHLWDKLASRAPACALHVDRMRRQHADILAHLDGMERALARWRATGRAAEAVPLLTALDDVNASLAVHLPDEETNVVPVMESNLSQKEFDEGAEHGRNATPRGKTWILVGSLMDAQPDGDAWLRHNMPAPFRLLWRTIGRRKYAVHRAALTGTG